LFVSELINLLLASRYNLKMGIPDVVLYLIGGSIATRVEMGLMMFPFVLILSKIFPVGIEATMWSFCFSVMTINVSIISPLLAVFINNNFIHCSVKNMDNYIYIKYLRVFGSLLPFLFMWLVPGLDEVDDVHKAHIEKATQKNEDKEEDTFDYELTTKIN